MSARQRAAFAPQDVADARRGRPAQDLAGWAAARGWEHLGSQVPSGFVSVVPVWPEHVFGCSRGELPGTGFVTVLHELYEIGVTPSGLSMPGSFHDVRSAGRWGWLGWWQGGARTTPFPRDAVWAPATRAAARVPRAALLPRICVRRSEHLPALGSVAVGGLRVAGDVAEPLRHALLGGGLGAALEASPHAFVEVVVAAGHVTVVRNGYADAHDLDSLLGVLAAAVRGACAAAAPDWVPGDFAAALPPPAWAPPQGRGSDAVDVLADGWRRAYRTVAVERGLALEDPVAFHRAFPDQPVPGRAQGVVRGHLADLGTTGRLAWFADGVAPVDGWVRGAVLFPSSAPPTPRGGVLDRETGLWAEVADGVAACWTSRRLRGRLAANEVLAGAAATARRLGLLPEERSR